MFVLFVFVTPPPAFVIFSAFLVLSSTSVLFTAEVASASLTLAIVFVSLPLLTPSSNPHSFSTISTMVGLIFIPLRSRCTKSTFLLTWYLRLRLDSKYSNLSH